MTENEKIINARPTKEFFIKMLTKDITKIQAIIDLVDNCVDGALRIRPERNFEDLWIRLDVTPDHFRINDNCGGIPVSLARDYAFRFGRPEQMEPTPHSIGQFGVGMKRAFFKLGSKFKVESRDKNSEFMLEEDVEEWRSEGGDWTFTFKHHEEHLSDVPIDEKGTTITVSNLHESISQDFKLDRFRNELRDEIEKTHRLTINDGLSISLNGLPVAVKPHKLLSSKNLKPAYKEIEIIQKGVSVNVKIFTGISESTPEQAGWYIYCNGRLILGADQTLTTGWGQTRPIKVPKYHNQFARFRGFTFFDSDDASLLPWNTTKTGVDADSKIYRGVRQQMYNMMRPVINFLNQLDAEIGVVDTDYKPLTNAIKKASHVRLTVLVVNNIFIYPKKEPKEPVQRKGRITYHKPQDQIDEVKKVLGVSKLIEVGEGTFDYFYDRECKE